MVIAITLIITIIVSKVIINILLLLLYHYIFHTFISFFFYEKQISIYVNKLMKSEMCLHFSTEKNSIELLKGWRGVNTASKITEYMNYRSNETNSN